MKPKKVKLILFSCIVSLLLFTGGCTKTAEIENLYSNARFEQLLQKPLQHKMKPLKPHQLKEITMFFENRPAKITYTEDKEYARAGLTGINSHHISRYRVTEKNRKTVQRQWSGGRSLEGSQTAGGVRLYGFDNPFLNTIEYEFYFSNKAIWFVPKTATKSVYAGFLILEQEQPYYLFMTVVDHVPQMNFVTREIYYEGFKHSDYPKQHRFVLESYIEMNASFNYLPLIKTRSLYKQKRYNYSFK